MAKTRAVFLSLMLEANDDGYLASVPGLQGAFAEGDTVEEAIFNRIDVVKMIAAYRAERGENLGFNEVELTPDTRMTVAVPVGPARASRWGRSPIMPPRSSSSEQETSR